MRGDDSKQYLSLRRELLTDSYCTHPKGREMVSSNSH